MQKEVEFFNKTSEEYLEKYGKEIPEGYSFRVRREKVLSLITNAAEQKSVLDIGCGPGIMIEDLLEKHCKIVCVDAAPEMINLVIKNYGQNPSVKAEVGDVTKMNFPSETFDITLAMGLLEYIEDQDTAINEIKRVTKTGGQIIISFPNKTSPWRIFNKIFLLLFRFAVNIYKCAFKKPFHGITHREYAKKEAIKLLAKNGLKIKKVIYYNFKLIPYPLDNALPKFTVWQSKLFEKLDTTFLKFLGTGFIVEAEK